MSAALSPERAQLLEDARRWNEWAEAMNAKALRAGLVTVEELAQNRTAAEEALGRLKDRLD